MVNEIVFNIYIFLICFAQVSDYAERNDAILLVIVPAVQAPEIASSRALRLAKEYDAEGKKALSL